MSTPGMAIGGLVGGAIGAMSGNAVMGAQIGMTLGSVIDPPQGPQLKRPTAAEREQTTSTYGTAIPRPYSKITTKCNYIWLENNKLEVREIDAGGKGAPPATAEGGFEYYATFAIGVCEGPIDAIGRIWCAGKLLYDPFATDLKTIRKSKKFAKKMTIYLGTDTQEPDPTIQADRGVDSTPAYHGISYLVIRSFKLTDYGNSLSGADWEVETVKDGAQGSLTLIQTVSGIYKQPTEGSYEHSGFNSAFLPRPYFMSAKKVLWYCPNWDQDTNTEPSSFFVYQTTESQMSLVNETPFYYNDEGDFEQHGSGVGDDKKLYWFFNKWLVGDDSGITTINGTFKHINGYNVGVTDTNIVWCAKSELDIVLQDNITPPSVFQLEVTDSQAATIDRDGNYVYVLCDDGIRKYTKELEYVSFSAQTFANGTMTNCRVCLDDTDDGVILWIFLECVPGGAYVYKFNTETEVLVYVARIPTQTYGSYWGAEVWVEDGIIIIAHPDTNDPDKLLVVDWYHEGALTSTNQTLDEIVEAECLLSNLLEVGDLDTADLTDEVRGFRVSDVASIRAGLEHLQTAFPFDVIQSGYQLKFIPRGQSSVASFTTDDLGVDKQLIESREMDTQIPYKVTVKCIDAESREYGTNEQYAQRYSSESVNVHEKMLAIVLSEDECAQVAEVLLYLYWMERSSFEFTLPPSARYLEPSDVITHTADYATFYFRLTSVSYDADGTLRCTAKPNNAAIYTSTAVGSTGQVTSGSISGHDSDTSYALLDIPSVNDKYLYDAGFYIAAYGDEDDWAGGVIMRSTDGGANFDQIAASYYETTLGICQNALGDIDQPYMINASPLLNVQFVADTPSSVTQAQLLNGSNTFAYGADGRWEIVGIQNWELEADESYTGSQMLRGLFGSESHASTHQIGDKLIHLNDADLLRFQTSINTVGLTHQYRGISFNEDLDSDDNTDFVYEGVNLKPLAPVHVSYYRDASSNINIAWTRQDRFPDDFRNNVEEPMSESTEAYRTIIYTDNNYDTVLREITSTIESCQYTTAQQVTDGTSGDSDYYFAVYQMSSEVGYGYPSTDVASAPLYDPYFSNVSLLLHFDGSDTSTTFTDSSSYAHTATVNGNAQIDTAYQLYGTGSGLFDGTGDYITFPDHAAFEFGAGDFTLEIAGRFNALPGVGVAMVFINKGSTATTNLSFATGILNDAGVYKLRFASTPDGTTATIHSFTISIATGGFYTFSYARVGSTLYFFQDKVLLGSVTESTNFYNGGAVVAIGANQTGTSGFNGWIDELRITKGTGRYTTTYTTPDAAFPNV